MFRSVDGALRVWSSRHHRKGLPPPVDGAAGLAPTLEALARATWRCLWMPRRLNWWIGAVFALGSLLFAVGSVLSLWPALAASWSLDPEGVDAIFFAGSIPFTAAAYLQLFQAANAPEFPGPAATTRARRRVLVGWRPHDVGWLSCVLQFVGTLLFNVNTLDAMLPSLTWIQQDLAVWVPDVLGSILFLASGYLAFIEICHAVWAFRPEQLAWWVTFVNLLGCVGFMVAALLAFVPPGAVDAEAVTLSLVFTLQGALCFFVGSCLMLPEAAASEEVRPTSPSDG